MLPLRLDTSLTAGLRVHAGAPQAAASPDEYTGARQDAAARRLLYLITQFDTGGAQAQLLRRLTHLDRRRFDVTVCVLTRQSGFLLDKVRRLGVRVIGAELERLPNLHSRLRRLREVIAAHDPDVVVGLLCWDHTYGVLAASLAGVPLIVAELHNEREAVRRAFSRRFRFAEALALGCCADLVVGCSERVTRSYAQAWPWIRRRATAVANGIDPLEAPVRLPRRAVSPSVPLVIGTMGRLMAQKNHALLLRALAPLCRRHPNIQLLVAGDGPLRAELEQLIRAEHLAAQVTLVGETQTPYSFLGQLDIFVLSSAWEGLPLVAMEAMACGIPVVSTDVGGVSELVSHGHNGLLCSAGDAAGLERAIAALVEDPDLRARLGTAARDTVRERFDVRVNVDRMSRLYDRAPQRRSRLRLPEAADATAIGPARTNQLPALCQPERILLFRLCPQTRALAIAAQLRAAYPTARLDVLCQDEWGDAVRQALPDAGVVCYGRGRFSVARLGVSRIRQLRHARYNLVVVPYNAASRAGYGHAEIAGSLVGRGRVLCYAAWLDDVAPAGLETSFSLFRIAIERRLALLTGLLLAARALGRGLLRRMRRANAAQATEVRL